MARAGKTELYLGLMSGTSMDGVDAALCEFSNRRFVRVVTTEHRSYAPGLRSELMRLQQEMPPLALSRLAQLDHAVAEAFAETAAALIKRAHVAPARIRAAGSHGQTVFHDPKAARSSLQLGDPSVIAAKTGVTVVADFRRADIARGGQGAPLVPAFHHATMARADEPRCIVNIGGIANVTVLPDNDPAKVRGFDTGPGNCLMDDWSELQRGKPMDAGGQWAAGGNVIPQLLDGLMRDPYFKQAPPKSTGRGNFHLAWAATRSPALAGAAAADVQCTLCELTARTITNAIKRYARDTRRVLICGGGVLNEFLVARLRALSPAMVESTESVGLAPLVVESAAFAWLAMRTLHGLPGNLPGVTGASGPAVLGGVYRA